MSEINSNFISVVFNIASQLDRGELKQWDGSSL